MLNDKRYKIIIIILLIIILMGVIPLINSFKKEIVVKDNNQNIFEQAYSLTTLERDKGSTSWPTTIYEKEYNIYLAAEKSANNTVITVKGKLVNKSSKELKKLVLVKYISSSNPLETMPVQGKEVLLGSNEANNAMEFSFDFNINEMNGTQFMITVLNDNQNYQYNYYN